MGVMWLMSRGGVEGCYRPDQTYWPSQVDVIFYEMSLSFILLTIPFSGWLDFFVNISQQ